MGPGAALATSIRRAFQFSGRATRSEFWWTWLILYFVGIQIRMYRGLQPTGSREESLLTVALCLVALPMIAVGTRRLADAGFWRWLFVLTVALGTATQLAYMFAMPSPSDFAMMTIMAERNDVDLPMTGYELQSVMRTVRNDILPWSSRICAIACLILAAFPSRRVDLQPGQSASEATR
ncbi:MAG: DUF805 domain-containing protein [Proteobacteria bacterium]|nr:DUF805 domain-containing protein [Pseudomonadota bacterium]